MDFIFIDFLPESDSAVSSLGFGNLDVATKKADEMSKQWRAANKETIIRAYYDY